MFGIFVQNGNRLAWAENAKTIEDAKAICEDYREKYDFAVIVRLEHFADFDGEREEE